MVFLRLIVYSMTLILPLSYSTDIYQKNHILFTRFTYQGVQKKEYNERQCKSKLNLVYPKLI